MAFADQKRSLTVSQCLKHNGSYFSGQRLVFEPKQRWNNAKISRASKRLKKRVWSTLKLNCQPLQPKAPQMVPHTFHDTQMYKGLHDANTKQDGKHASHCSVPPLRGWTAMARFLPRLQRPQSVWLSKALITKRLSRRLLTAWLRAFPSFTTALGAIWPRTPIIPPATTLWPLRSLY